MKNKPFLMIGVLFVVVLAPLIHAEPLITGIFYDPTGVDTGFEWIELYNPTDEPIDLTQYILVKGNGAVSNDWSELPQLTGTLLPESFFLIGEANVSDADLTLKLALFNGPDAVALHTVDNETVDVVGYGALTYPEYFAQAPTVDAASGLALRRVFTISNGTHVFSQTQNNSHDWEVVDLQPRNSLYQYVLPLIQNTSVTLVVPQLPVLITQATLSDEQPSKQGTQWSLVGKKRIELSLDDESGSFNTSRMQLALVRGGISRIVDAQVQRIDSGDEDALVENTTLTISLQLGSDLFAGNYSLQITIENDADSQTTFVYPVEILPSIGMTVCDDMLLERESDGTYRGSCRVTNIGNVAAAIGMNLTFDSHIQTQPYLLQNQTYIALTNATLRLAAGESRDVVLVANVSRIISFGTYTGTLQVRAWAIQ